MVEMWLPFRCRLRRDLRWVRGRRSEREVRELYSRFKDVRVVNRGEGEGMGDRKGIWLEEEIRFVRSGKDVARVATSDQERRVSSRESSRMLAKAEEAEARSEGRTVKRLPLD